MCFTHFRSSVKGCKIRMLKELDTHRIFIILKFLRHAMTTACNSHDNGLCKQIKHPTPNINVGCWNHLPYGLFKIFLFDAHLFNHFQHN